MAISVDTTVLRIEGQTDGAVKATQAVTKAQKELGQEANKTAASLAKAADAGAQMSAASSPGVLAKIGAGFKSLGFDSQTFSNGLKDIGKGLTFDLIRNGIKGISSEVGGLAGATLSAATNGAAMGAAFGGPLGSAIGAVGGALVGLIRGTNEQTEAQLRAAAAAKKHADELQRIANGETKARAARQGSREAENRAYQEWSVASTKNTMIGSEASAADLERARRELAMVRIEREALNRADGAIWLEQQKRDQEFINSKRDIEAARAKEIITVEEADRRLKALTQTETDSLDIVGQMRKKQQETAEAVERLNVALKAGKINWKEYQDLINSVDEDARKRDEDRKKREAEAHARWKQRQAERKASAKAWAPILDRLTMNEDGVKGDPWRSARIAEAEASAQAAAMIAAEEEAERRDAAQRAAGYGVRDSVIDARDSFGQVQKEFNKGIADNRKSRLEQMFGSVDEINGYKVAFEGLTGAVSAGLNAWITGSESAGQAVKKFIGTYLAGIATQMAIDSLKEGAAAIASLAWHDYTGAAAHAKAAAAYGAGAVAAAAAAKALGGGGSTPSGGAASGGAGATGLGGGTAVSGPQTNVTIVTGNPFDESSPRMRRLQADRMWARARGTTGVVQE